MSSYFVQFEITGPDGGKDVAMFPMMASKFGESEELSLDVMEKLIPYIENSFNRNQPQGYTAATAQRDGIPTDNNQPETL